MISRRREKRIEMVEMHVKITHCNNRLTLDGRKSVFNLVRTYWTGYAVPRGLIVKNDAISLVRNWGKSKGCFISIGPIFIYFSIFAMFSRGEAMNIYF
jgi:hypothetical protein